ncbi:hypothetical protein BDZ89DRAFT_907149, partial [Hymenopellis radicata]
CFPHVVNIAVKHGLKHCTSLPWDDPDLTDAQFDDMLIESAELLADSEYAAALKGDAVATVRRLIQACCASDGDARSFHPLLLHQLLKDVDTRWSSTFLMIDRVLELYLPVKEFLKNHNDLNHLAISDVEINVLNDIRTFLSFPHAVQELISAEQTPTLSLVIPLYEQLIEKLRALRSELPKLQHAIDASISKLEEYLAYSRKTQICNLAI